MKKEFRIFETEGQRKKHVSQMSKDELTFLNHRLDEIRYVKKSYHLLDRKDTGKIPERIFKDILRNPSRRTIVEYNETTRNGRVSKRILVRDARPYRIRFYQSHDIEAEGYANLCFVIDYETGRIITAYYNYDKDDHITLDMSRYDETLEVISTYSCIEKVAA